MKKSLFPILFVLFIVSCSDIKTSSYFKPPVSKLDSYSALEVRNFESNIEKFPSDELIELSKTISQKLNANITKFESVVIGNISSFPDDKTLVLLGEISEYGPASDIRYESGKVKFGEVTLNISLAILEKSTGKEITRGDVNTFSSFGFNKKKMYEEVANEVVKFISEN